MESHIINVMYELNMFHDENNEKEQQTRIPNSMLTQHPNHKAVIKELEFNPYQE